MSTSDRLLALLDLFTMDRPDWSVEEAAARLDLALSTAYRYFNSLSASGLLTSYGRGRYGLGPAIIRYDRQLRLTDPLVLASRPVMEHISQMVPGNGVAFVCRLFGEQVMCVAQAAVGEPSFAVGYERGRMMPLFAGSASLVVLAAIPSRSLRALHRRQADTFVRAGLGGEWAEVRAALRAIRDAGHCVRSGEVDKGMRGVSVPVSAPGGAVLGSLSVAGPRDAIGSALVARLIEMLGQGAQTIERELERINTSRALDH